MILCIVYSSENASALCLIYFSVIISTVNISPALQTILLCCYSFSDVVAFSLDSTRQCVTFLVDLLFSCYFLKCLQDLWCSCSLHSRHVRQLLRKQLQPGRSFGHYNKNCSFTALQRSAVPWLVLYVSLEITLYFFSIRKPEVISDNIN